MFLEDFTICKVNKLTVGLIFKDDLYFAAVDQIYLYKNKGDWKAFGDRCFVMPIKNTDPLVNRKEESYD